MITYTFEQSKDEQYIDIHLWLCGACILHTTRRVPLECDTPDTYFDTEASRATLLEAAQPTIDALRSYFEDN